MKPVFVKATGPCDCLREKKIQVFIFFSLDKLHLQDFQVDFLALCWVSREVFEEKGRRHSESCQQSAKFLFRAVAGAPVAVAVTASATGNGKRRSEMDGWNGGGLRARAREAAEEKQNSKTEATHPRATQKKGTGGNLWI